MPGLQLVVLCEDKQHEAFASRFLKARGFENRFRIEKIGDRPAVFRRFQQEVLSLRGVRNQRPSLRLIVVIDGDTDEPDALRRRICGQNSAVASAFRDVEELVAIFLPRRNIETWIRYLEGFPVDELTLYPKEHKGRERGCKGAVRTLVDQCESGKFPAPPPSSLERACEEFHRVLRN